MIINRYLLKEILYTLLAVMSVLLVVFLSNRLIGFLADASAGRLPSDAVLALLGLKILGAFVIILPLGFFMSVLLAFSRLYKDNEMVALAACGVGMRTLYRSVAVLAAVVALLVAAISLYLGPWAEEQAYRISDQVKARSNLAGIASGRFTQPEGASGVIYVERVSDDGRVLHNVFIQGDQRGRGQIIIAAERGFQRRDAAGDPVLVLVDGRRYEGLPGSPAFRIISFKEHAVRLGAEESEARSLRQQRARPTAELLASHESADLAELQWRISMPLSVLFLGLLAVPLSRTSPRQGKYARLVVAVLVYLIYNNMLGVADTWVARGVLPPALGMWWVHLGLLAAAGILLARQYGSAWLLRSMFGRGVSP